MLLEGLALLTMFGAATYWPLIGKYKNYFGGLVYGIRDATVKTKITRLIDGLMSLNAIYKGKQLRVQYAFRNSKDELQIQFAVVQKLWLRLLPQRIPSEGTNEIEVGDKEFDGRYLIHSDQPEAAREYLSRFFRDHLARIKTPFERLEIHRGWFTVLFLNPQSNMDPEEFHETLDTLHILANDYEQRGLQFKVIAVGATEFCPYCRSKLESEVVVECTHCGTRLHSSCWSENGQCTTWGCKSMFARAAISER